MKTFILVIYDFFALFFPRICAACGNTLLRHEDSICSFCLWHLPKTGFHLDSDNPISRVFWGRVNIESAYAYLYFHKGSRVQQIIHQLKYKGKRELGIKLGEIYGQVLQSDGFANKYSYIIPVPLHPVRKRQRGYNQSEMFAIGLSSATGVPVDTKTLTRIMASETQTRKSRFSRWENVKEIFDLKESSKMEGKHLLLVDDVITTGATLEACANQLTSIPGVKVSIAAIACALK